MQVMLEMQDALVQLQAAGHPDHQDASRIILYELAQGLDSLESAKTDLCMKADSWREQIERIHQSYHQTLWLTTHQLVLASELLQSLLTDGEQLHSTTLCHILPVSTASVMLLLHLT